MPLLEQKELNEKNLFKLLKKSVKKIIVENGLDPNTKKGNKELDFLLKKIAKIPFSSLEQVQERGEKIGHTIVELSQERGKTYLDQGIIRHIILKGENPLVAEASTVKTSVTPKSKAKSVETIIPSKPKTPVAEKSAVIPPVVVEVEEKEEIEEKLLPTPVVEVEEEEVEEINPPHPAIIEEVIDEEEEINPAIEAVTVGDEEEAREEEPIKPETKPLPTKEIASISLKDQIGEDLKTAMKSQDKIRLETVRGIKKVILEKEIALRPDGQDSLTPEQEIEVLSQQAKQRRDSIEQYTNAGRDDLAEKEAQELAIIETYLPKQLTDEELTEIIDEIIAAAGATSVKDLGKVMGVAMKQLKGKADGKKIQEKVKSQLS